MKFWLVIFFLSAVNCAAQGIPLPAYSYTSAVQVDSTGNLYVAGFFTSPSDSSAPAHAFAAKLSPDGTQTIWRTVLAGSKDDRTYGLALGPGNAVYVTGTTQSADFPTMNGAMATAGHAFAAKLDANGAVVYSTYIPATSGQAIAVDAAGHAFITGALYAGDALQATPGAVSGAPTSDVNPSAYILELDPAGSKALLAISGFGGGQIALDGQGDIFAAGAFEGPFAPTTPGAFQPSVTARACVTATLFETFYCPFQHIAKIDPTGTRLLYATYVTGSWGASPVSLAIDVAGNAILAGSTYSPDYPTTPAAYEPEYAPNPAPQAAGLDFTGPPSTGYITKLNASGTGLLWSTFLGGSGGPGGSFIIGDTIAGMSIDAAGNILLAGSTNSKDFPGLWNTPVASRPVVPAGTSAPLFVTRLSADGEELSATQLLKSVSALLSGGPVLAVGPFLLNVSIPPPGRVTTIADPADNAKLVSVAPGQLLTLYGTNLAPFGIPASPNGYPTEFNGVSMGFNGIAAPILYTASNQINLQVPYEIAGQSQVTMQVSSQSVTPAVSESYIFAVNARQPSVFVSPAGFQAALFDIAECNGQSVAGAQPLALNADGSVNSCANPTAAGSPVTVFVNGLGVTAPAQTTGAISPGAVAVTPAVTYVKTLPTQTIPGLIADVVQVQAPAPGSSSAVALSVAGTLLRGPGVVIWSAAGH